MKGTFVLLLLSLFSSAILSQTPPHLSETFSASVRVVVSDGFGEHVGNGMQKNKRKK
jgi:hypothetical protein